MGSLSTLERRRRYYTRIYDQTYSPCGQFMAAGDGYGKVHVFDLEKSISPKEGESQKFGPDFMVELDKERSIFAVESTQDWFLCGDSKGNITGFAWSELLGEKSDSKQSFQVNDKKAIDCEVNVLRVGSSKDKILAGTGGDNAVKIIDIDSGVIVQRLCGHTDMILDIAVRNENEVISASEDGSLIFWDLRSSGQQFSIKPYETECARPNCGKWIACCEVNKNWLICGGGPQVGLFHLGGGGLTKILNTTDIEAQTHSIALVDDKILAGSDKGKVHQWNFSGENLCELQVNQACVFSILHNSANQDYAVTSVVGCSPKIDVLIDSGYVAYSVEIP